MTVAGIFCADYHSLYKPYFCRQVNSFKTVSPVVCTWSTGENPGQSGIVTSIGCEWGLDRLPKPIRRLCAHLGFSVAAGTQCEHAATASLIDSHSMDVVLAHTGFVADRIFEPVVSRGIPLVVYLHGGDLREAMKSKGWRKRLQNICSKSEKVIVVGNYMVDQVAELGISRDKICVIPVGAPVKERIPTAEYGEDNHFVFVGRLVPCKAVDVIIEAISIARLQGIDIRLSIIGDGPLASKLQEQAHVLGVADLIKFEGIQDSNFVNEALDQSSGLVIHTVDEPGGPEAFGVVVTEAMAAARPVIISNCGGLIDQVDDGVEGCVVEQRDAHSLSQAMIRLGANQQLRQTYGNSARQRALREFDAADLGAHVENVLIEIVNSIS